MSIREISESLISTVQRLKIERAGFQRQAVSQTLPSGLGSVNNKSLTDYLEYYSLAPLAEQYGHRIGCYSVPVADGYRIVAQQFGLNPQSPQILLMHGYLTHTGHLVPMIDHLCQQGFQVITFDLPGHGLSSGAPYTIADFSHYTELLAFMIRSFGEHLRPGFTFMAHSTSAAIVTDLYAHTQWRQLAPDSDLIFLAPLLWPTRSRLISMQYRLLHRLLKKVRRFYRANSHDLEFLKRMRDDPLQYDFIPVPWVGAMVRWCREIDHYPQLMPKAHIIQGTCDDTVDWKRNLPLLERIYPRHEITVIEGAMHELINEDEPWRGQIFAAIDRALMGESKQNGLPKQPVQSR